ncbi:class I SAM-dependent methyltransferase [Rhizomicrobium electricum]|uniref:Class I SAM-dependent methyltransferase n=1 Tax=Rhizomicrobium electricum TaxID=480070 RepID=A0ABP3P659_9PROT|nr:class I SAM-dependent methyltransferase [Rhizomicrobium electricum]NIJ47896.1 hypothetical protein [Rhizomicrobium electricum]
MNTHPHCRFCGTPMSQVVLDLGEQPLANSFLSKADLDRSEEVFRLCVRVCNACWLMQTDATPDPRVIFSDYVYFSSYSDLWMRHARDYCAAMTARFGIGRESFVIEVASNDGYLLRNFVADGVRCLGIEPAENVAAVARKADVPTESVFLGVQTARDIASRHGRADLMAANNVLAHVPDINDFVAGLAILLADSGVLTVEFPHVANLIELCQFDTIYHEHFSYLSLTAVETIFARHGLSLFDVEELPTHGGSLRLYVRHGTAAPSDRLAALRAREAALGVTTPAYYERFNRRAQGVIAAVRGFLAEAKATSKQVVAYGAAAKGNTLLNACGATTAEIAYAVDRSPHKQNKWLPGSHLPVFSPERIAETKPDYVFILPWNIKSEIAAQMKHIGGWGGKFVTAIPELQVFEP